ncbi:Ces1l1 [Columba livia]|nr:Ces1l1 [Columba livia]
MATGKDALLLSLILTVGVTVLVATGHNAEQPEVETKYGRVRGYRFKVDAAERSVNVFLGLPFAKPPVGPLRFSEPQPPEPWKGVRDATSYPPMCLQDKEKGNLMSYLVTNRKEKVYLQVSEDCLYLNVYTPVATEKQELPVFVWIHGGALVCGAGSSYDGSALAAFDNVVVVTIQYRLGILGYFSTGDKHAPGNWGYLDQVAALQWIQENIRYFGGDPGSVTIAGESAGGISVSALVLSPLAKGLFHKAISESGTASRLLFTDHPEEAAKRVAAASDCEKPSSAAIVECLREKTEEEIVQIAQNLPTIYAFATADGVFFPKRPVQLLFEKLINPVPYLIGVNNCEFGWVMPTSFKIPASADGLDEDVARQHLQGLLAMNIKGVTSEVVDRVYNEYIGNAANRIQVRDGFLDAVADAWFVFPSIEVARHHRDAGNPVYFYEFQHRPSSATGVVPEFVKADHGAEVAFVFGKPFLAGNATEEENKLSRSVMRYWTNFARNGNPNGEGLVHWPQYNLDEGYMEIDLMQRASKKLKERKMEFWTQLLKEMVDERREHSEL